MVLARLGLSINQPSCGCSTTKLARNCSVEARQERVNAKARASERDLVSAVRQAALRSSSSAAALQPASTSIITAWGKVATGVPQDKASNITRPNVSVRLGKTLTSLAA